jgi:hypothetical protein
MACVNDSIGRFVVDMSVVAVRKDFNHPVTRMIESREIIFVEVAMAAHKIGNGLAVINSAAYKEFTFENYKVRQLKSIRSIWCVDDQRVLTSSIGNGRFPSFPSLNAVEA